MRIKRKRKHYKQRKVIIIVSICFLFIMTVGYAAFQTNLSITAKGNIKDINAAKVLIKTVVGSGDGLYVDEYESNRYFYKGTNPNNYITFNGEKAGWRIVSVEPDETLKIMKVESVVTMPYDNANARQASYCTHPQYGCSVWGSNTTMLDTNGQSITKLAYQLNGTEYELPTTEASVNIYLNQTYYNNNLGDEAKLQLETHYFNVGKVSRTSGQLLETDVQQEKENKWKGNIGLITTSDYVRASNNNACTNVYSYYNNANCYSSSNEHNYLNNNTTIWTISPCAHSNSHHNWDVFTSGKLDANYSFDNRNVHPTLYLKSDIKLSGSGTKTDPYIIKL